MPTASSSSGPSDSYGTADSAHLVAFVIRGVLFRSGYTPRSNSAKSLNAPYKHDFLQQAWPSMKRELIEPAKQHCGYSIHLYVVTHNESVANFPPDFIDRVHAEVKPHNGQVFMASGRNDQWDVAGSFLRERRSVLSRYELVIMTRDDFVYAPGSWHALSTRYLPDHLNLVSSDCAAVREQHTLVGPFL